MAENIKSILIVDDDPEIRTLLKRFLGASGYIVKEAQDGQNAILKADQLSTDLILLDLNMPHLGGFATIKKLKRDPLQKNIPVIVLTASQELDSVKKAIELGAIDYVLKPPKKDDLLHRVGKALGVINFGGIDLDPKLQRNCVGINISLSLREINYSGIVFESSTGLTTGSEFSINYVPICEKLGVKEIKLKVVDLENKSNKNIITTTYVGLESSDYKLIDAWIKSIHLEKIKLRSQDKKGA